MTCPISWPSTAASSASLPSRRSSPSVTKIGPPGSAKAFTVRGSASTWKLNR
jgi:hypothetical protein